MARASGRDLDVSFKKSVEVCNAIRGMNVEKAKLLLEKVIKKEIPIPFKKFKRNVGHRKQLNGWKQGKYPVKAARYILKVIENAESNAEELGLDIDRLWIKHACAQKGPKLRRIFYRAMGRSTPKIKQLVHVEIVLEEK